MHRWMLLGVVVVGCSGEPAPPPPPSVAFSSPAPGAALVRDQLAPGGALVAPVPIAVATTGDVARVAITAGDAALGDVDVAGALAGEVGALGTVTLTATAFDDAGAPLATASVDVMVADPELADCHAWLDLYRLSYTLGPANPGVADPVTVTVPINGMSYRYSGNAAARKTFFMDCSLARSLAQAAAIERAHDVTEIIDIGVYNYRCIGSVGTPPNCPQGMSQHAFAKAIDHAAFVTSDGTTYTVKTDFVIDPDGKTCTADTEPGKDTWLHQIICELKAAKVWNIVLTPNYNADHRDHFHVDLSPNSDFIQREAAGTTIDTPVFDDSVLDRFE